MNSCKTKKYARKPLCSLETNILKHKRTSKGQNHGGKTNWTIPPRGSSLTREELTFLWIKYYTHGHFKDKNSELMEKKSMNKSKNGCITDKNFTTNENTQSIRIVSTNTWNWAQVTEINQSNKSLNEIKSINISSDTSDTNDFAEVFINQTWLQEKNTPNLSNTESNGRELYNDNDFIFGNSLETLESNQHISINNQFNQDNYKENFDPNIFSDFAYTNHHNKYNHVINDNYNILQEINIDQDSDQTINNNYWYDDNRNNFVQSLEAELNHFDKLDYTIYDNQSELNLSGDSLLEYFSL